MCDAAARGKLYISSCVISKKDGCRAGKDAETQIIKMLMHLPCDGRLHYFGSLHYKGTLTKEIGQWGTHSRRP